MTESERMATIEENVRLDFASAIERAIEDADLLNLSESAFEQMNVNDDELRYAQDVWNALQRKYRKHRRSDDEDGGDFSPMDVELDLMEGRARRIAGRPWTCA